MITLSNMKVRCPWVPKDNKLYIDYHDHEWGFPVHSDPKHFEFLVLEGAQAGLSWLTILKRRQGYRKNFANFDPQKVAKFSQSDINNILKDPGIIRNKLKINSAVNNANKFVQIQEEFGSFDNYIWKFVNRKTINHRLNKLSEYPVFTKEAQNLSFDLKKRGFTFVGPTVIYSHMQACGLVNDHTIDCFRHNQVK